MVDSDVDNTEELKITEKDDFDLHSWPFFWVTQSYGQYLLNLEEALKEIELDIPRWRVLMLLENDCARSTSSLAEHAISKLSTMTRIIGRMQHDGLVETRSKKTDGRVTEVFLTKHGRRARLLAWQQAYKVYKKAFEGISENDIKALNKTLGNVYSNLKAV